MVFRPPNGPARRPSGVSPSETTETLTAVFALGTGGEQLPGSGWARRPPIQRGPRVAGHSQVPDLNAIPGAHCRGTFATRPVVRRPENGFHGR